MERGALAVAVVCHEVVLVQSARTHTSRERNIDVFVFRHFGHRTFFIDPSRPRTRIPTFDLLCILPASNTVRCPLTGMLELPKIAFGEYIESIERHQNKLGHVWGSIPFRVSLR